MLHMSTYSKKNNTLEWNHSRGNLIDQKSQREDWLDGSKGKW